MRRMLACFILLLIFSTPMLAVPVDPNAPNEIAAFSIDDVILLRTNGEVYDYDYPTHTWVLNSRLEVPVPVADIADWQTDCFITHGSDWWYMNPDSQEWEILPQPEWAPVSSESSSMGGIKSMYR